MASSEAAERLAARLRAAGCVYAEDEAALLLQAAADDAALEWMARRRVAGEPLEHILGWVDFGGTRLAVGPRVFIPRQRSLLLARAAVREARSIAAPVVLELYAGVAPIAAFVAARVPGAELHAAELDDAALAHARRNLPAGAGLHRSDEFGALPAALLGRVDLLVAVPPYVPEGEARLLPHEAREHEPPLALYGGGEDGLDRLRSMLDGAGAWLRPGGLVLAELNRAQLPAALAHARGLGLHARGRLGGDGQTALVAARRARP